MGGKSPLAAVEVASQTAKRIWTHPENAHRRAKALGSYLTWQVWERTVRRPWTAELVPGRRIRCYPHAPISSAVIYYGLADASEMRFVLDLLGPGDVLFDVGANLGVYSVLATAVDGATAVAFEPNRRSQERLRENLELNDVTGRVTVVPSAVGAQRGTVSFTTELDAMNRIVTDPASAEGAALETVELVSLDEWCAEHGDPSPAVVKIDVEGHELDVLRGASALFERCSPALIVEVNDADALQDALDRLGYTCVAYDPTTRSLTPTTAQARAKVNVIAVRDPDHIRGRLVAP